METKVKKASITVKTTVNAPAEKTWTVWTDPKHIMQWNNASDDWHTPHAENDLRAGGKFVARMAARDGSAAFDFSGTYDRVEPHKLIEYTMDDKRKVKVVFEEKGQQTTVTETFEAESENSVELQKSGWQAILDNFKKHVESQDKLEKIRFETLIDAPAKTVYETMIDDKGYREWTRPFNESSHFIGSWDKGSTIRFIGTDKDGKSGGMLSKIRENKPGEFISIEHLGMIDGDREITSGPEVESWAGALENYTFKPEGAGMTRLIVEMDSNGEMKQYFEDTWPKAVKILKDMCESKTKK